MQSPDPFGWVGSTIDGQFAVEAIAGEGGFGIVYRGTHLGLEVPVAIKCLNFPARLSQAEQEGFLAKFRAEARLLHQLSRQTANIVQALDIGAATAPTGQWTPYIVMEWLDGETLEHDLDKRRKAGEAPRGLDAAIRILTPAAEALGIAHRDNVSHRDVKPANLFLWRSGGNTGMKVLDFGIAKVFSETPSLTAALAQTSEGRRAFTPRYGAPEQFSLSYGATGPWTDVFAMALILIEVASGRRVIQGETIVDLLIASVEAQHRPELLEGVTANDSSIAFVLRRALTVNPALRFPNMAALWSALGEARRSGCDLLGPTAPLTPDPSVAPAFSATLDGGALAATGAAPPAPPAPAVMGENRVCTVMVVDFASVAARLDAEELEEVFDRCQRVVAEHVEDLGGVVERFAGDCVIAAFGVPRATDNDAERAVLAALRIQAALGWVALPRAARGANLSATTVGINTGRVFARVGAGPGRPDLTVVGEVVGVAARIRQAASAGEIVIGRDTYRQIASRFNVEPLAPVVLPGRAEPVPCYRVKSMIAFQAAFAATDFHGVETKLVGRAGERQRLIDALETTLSERRARLVTMVGVPGIGRSRLLADFFSGLTFHGKDITVLIAQCSPLAQETSYGLAGALLRRRFDIRASDDEDTIRRRLRFGLRWFRLRTAGVRREDPDDLEPTRDALDPAEIDAALTPLVGVLGLGPKVVTDSIALDEAGQAAKQRIAAAASLLVRFAARRTPIVVLCDDLQWADDGSLDLLRDLVRRADDLPLLIVGSARPELLERRPDWGEGDETEERIPITPLSRRSVEEMVKDRLRAIPALSPELLRVLTDRAEGNPLILEETLHLLVDAGVIEVRAGEAWAFREERLGALTLPATIQGIVQSRLDRLEPELREALAQAAVVGRTFWEGSLQHLRQAAPNVTPGPSANALIHELRERQLVRMRDRATLPGEREATFAESATHEVVYDMLSLKIRRPLHLLVAAWLEQRATSSSGAALLALHYDRGGDAARAVAAYGRAAAHAASVGENGEAIRHLTRASAILDEAREDEAQSRGDTTGAEEQRIASFRERVRLRLELGDALRRAGRPDEAERAYDEARARVLRVPRRAGEVLDPREALRWDARVDARLALLHKVRGASAEARALIERAITGATEAGAADETPAMYALLTFLLRRERRPEESWQVARRGLRICRSISRRDDRWQETVAQLLLGVALAAFACKRYVTAERTYRQVSRLASEATHPHQLGAALNGVAGVHLVRGDLAGARDALLRSMRFKERAGDLHPIAVGYNNLAEVELRLKEIAPALDHARRAVRLGEQARAGSDLADFYRNLAEASLAAGELDAAIVAGRKALTIAEDRGRLYLGDAAVTLARAVARAAEASTPGTILHTAAREAAAALRASLAEHFEEGDLREKAEECRKLLAQVSAALQDTLAIEPGRIEEMS